MKHLKKAYSFISINSSCPVPLFVDTREMGDAREIVDARETFDEGANSGSSSRVEIEVVEPDMMWVKKNERPAEKKRFLSIE